MPFKIHTITRITFDAGTRLLEGFLSRGIALCPGKNAKARTQRKFEDIPEGGPRASAHPDYSRGRILPPIRCFYGIRRL
jgi:hypothetical protein